MEGILYIASVLETKVSRGRGRGRQDMFLHEHRAAQLGFLPSAGGPWERVGTGLWRKEALRQTEKRVDRSLQIQGWNLTTDIRKRYSSGPKVSSPPGKREFSDGSHRAQSGLELAPWLRMNFELLIFLPPLPEFWNHSPASSHLGYAVLQAGDFLLGKSSTHRAAPQPWRAPAPAPAHRALDQFSIETGGNRDLLRFSTLTRPSPKPVPYQTGALLASPDSVPPL